jgi:ferric-dicitrate binding protein FerR (iron transport regulator)
VKQNFNDINDELLVKYLLGEATSSEEAAVQQWIGASPENARYAEHFRLIWEESKKLGVHSTADENKAWERFRQRTGQAPQTTVHTRTISLRSAARIAAVLIVLLGAGFLAYRMNRTSTLLSVQSDGVPVTATLPDGSVVTLNKSSSLSYPEHFNGSTRSVTLKGEAFFNITPDKSHPFIIDANGVAVKVVGTSFNVKTTKDETEVIVETGIVEVRKKDNAVKLNPHEKATVLKNEAKPVKQNNTDELYNYYRTKKFVCNDVPLPRFVEVLSEAYGVQIVLGDERLRHLSLNTTFDNDSLDGILAVIASTFNIRAEQRGGQIVLYPY